MHSSQNSQILWASIIASAAVAALVTLLMEYLAKPQLEARKERILERHQQRRAAVLGLRQVAHLPQRIEFYKTAEIMSELPARERIQAAIMEAENLILTAFEILVPSSSYLPLWQGEVGAVTAYLSFTASDPFKDKPKGVTELIGALNYYADLFSLPLWRWKRRHILLRKIKELEPLKHPPVGGQRPKR